MTSETQALLERLLSNAILFEGSNFVCDNVTRPSDAVERVAQILRTQREHRYEDEALADDALIDRCNAEEIIAAIASMPDTSRDALHIVFDGPPCPEAGRFVECETPDGRSVNAGEWHERSDGHWELRLATPHADVEAGYDLAVTTIHSWIGRGLSDATDTILGAVASDLSAAKAGALATQTKKD